MADVKNLFYTPAVILEDGNNRDLKVLRVTLEQTPTAEEPSELATAYDTTISKDDGNNGIDLVMAEDEEHNAIQDIIN
jgi:hypothetical protein